MEVLSNQIKPDSIDCIVTSPPYDGIRQYKEGNIFDLSALGVQINRVLKDGCFAVVVIADQKKRKRMSLTTARLMIDWVDNAGLSLCDWMIFHRTGRIGKYHSFRRDHESILVFFKGESPNDINIESLKRPVKHSLYGKPRIISMRNKDDSMSFKPFVSARRVMCRGTVWHYPGWGGALPGVWHYKHPALMREELARDLVLAFSQPGDLVLDPFCGSGTTGVMAINTGRDFAGIDISSEYCDLTRERISQETKQLDVLSEGVV